MRIERFLTPYMRSYCYVITDNGKAVVVDPCKTDEIAGYLDTNVQELSYCILTHEHYDHISGLDWMHKIGVPVVASEECNRNLADPKKNQSRYYDVFCMVQRRLMGDEIMSVKEYTGYADRLFVGEKEFQWEGHTFFLKETPGHSDGGICILVDEKILFSGDTLFAEYDTNTDERLGGNEEKLQSISIPWLQSLDGDTIVYPGHYEVFRLEERMKGK